MVDAQGSFFKDRRSSSEVGYLATCLRRGDSIFLVKFMVVCFCKQSHFCKMQVCDNLCFTMSSLTDELLKIQKKKGQKRVKLLITVTPRILRFVKKYKNRFVLTQWILQNQGITMDTIVLFCILCNTTISSYSKKQIHVTNTNRKLLIHNIYQKYVYQCSNGKQLGEIRSSTLGKLLS